MSESTKSTSKAFPLVDTLHDLALLRASAVDLSTVLTPTASNTTTTTTTDSESLEILKSTERSYEFVQETRGALRVYNSGELQRKRAEIQHVQGELDEVLKGLS